MPKISNTKKKQVANPKKGTSDKSKLNPDDFLRIGTEYFKRTHLPLISGDTLDLIIKWSRSAITDDLGTTSWRDFTSKIPRYDGFCCFPSHLDYERESKGYYNRYEPFKYQDSIKEGTIDCSIQFVKHIFGEQFELGLDYLQLLLEKPSQKLPILCLVSKERETGKSTFVFWLKEIFGGNATVNTNQDFESNFNADWSSKLLIMVEETLLEKREIGERLKYLSTTQYAKTEAKGKDKYESEFFGKFILCSNNEDSFIKIDKEETRYWVRKVNSIDHRDPQFQEKLKAEIPAFLHFLNNRKMTTAQTTRLWFDEQLLVTDELKALKKNSRDHVEKEIEGLIVSKMEDCDLQEVCYTITDILKELKQLSGFRFTQQQVQNVLRKKWNLHPVNNALAYQVYSSEGGTIISTSRKGRYYKFEAADFMGTKEGQLIKEEFP